MPDEIVEDLLEICGQIRRLVGKAALSSVVELLPRRHASAEKRRHVFLVVNSQRIKTAAVVPTRHISSDGVHLTHEGNRVLLRCLYHAVPVVKEYNETALFRANKTLRK